MGMIESVHLGLKQRGHALGSTFSTFADLLDTLFFARFRKTLPNFGTGTAIFDFLTPRPAPGCGLLVRVSVRCGINAGEK
jgi:hypothetical protein